MKERRKGEREGGKRESKQANSSSACQSPSTKRVKGPGTGVQWPHMSLVFTRFTCFQLLFFQMSPNPFQSCVTVLINCYLEPSFNNQQDWRPKEE